MIGRYEEADPIGIKRGENHLYGYVGNNPSNRNDPKGLNWYGNWCGPGGSGPMTDCYDAACKRHDECYKKCRVNWLTRWLPVDLYGSICAGECDQELIKDWKRCACSNGASGSW
jgi:hypothetical protein